MTAAATQTNGTLAVLAYHRIGVSPQEWQSWFYTSEAMLENDLRWLAANEYRMVGLDELLRGLDEPGRLPPRAAMITFDDAFRSVRTAALPLLRRFGCPGVVFVPTDYIGLSNEFDGGAQPTEALCDWDDLRELEAGGIRVESHGASHRFMSELTAAERDDELARSKAVLEAGLGRRIEAFAFPFGDGGKDPGAMTAALRQAGYRAAFSYAGGPSPLPVRDRFRITRIALGSTSNLAEEMAKN